MPLHTDETIVRLTKDGASCEIYFYGATVTSWKAAGPRGGDAEERLWLSKTAVLDGSAPIRGGIPIAFPIFAVDVHPDYPNLGGAHGFARINKWKLDDAVAETDSEIKAVFRLSSSPEIETLFPHPFELIYDVILTKSSLTTTIHVTNPSTAASEWRFNTAFHTYFQVPNSLEATISPLKGIQYIDRLHGMKEAVQQNDTVLTKVETASVYKLGSRTPFEVLLSYGGNEGVDIISTGFEDAVLWNPREVAGSKVPDLHAGGWDNFLCWEPGVISNFKTLKPGNTFVGVQKLVVHGL